MTIGSKSDNTVMTGTSFSARLGQRVKRFGPLCVGIDPSPELLARCGLPDNADAAFEFGRRVMTSVDFEIAAVKPQFAYFERYGSAGIKAVEALGALARAHEVVWIADAKRGDIDASAAAYGEAFFAPSSLLRADALTLTGYLGIAALGALIDIAVKNAAAVFLVVRSSNAEGAALQLARRADGRTVAEEFCDEITALNARVLQPLAAVAGGDTLGPIGAVVGATCEDAASTIARMPSAYILAPGIGAQGATFADLRRRMPGQGHRVLPSVSRAIVTNGTTSADIGATIRALQAEAAT